MPRATAQIGEVVVAQTEHWEFVEGNVYVWPFFWLEEHGLVLTRNE